MTTPDQTEQRPVLRREFSAELTAGDGRTVDCRIVPYGERIQHDDGLGGLPKGMPYTEEWAAGAFTHQLKAANRVLANVEHQEGLAGIVGHGVALVERHDGLYGSFRLHENPDGDKALMLIREGVMNTVSLEAVPQKNVRTHDGVVRRVKAHLRAVAFVRFGAYPGATVLAVREQAEIEDELPPKLQPVPMNPELVESLQRLGMELPQRYQAHPDETDTPAQTGTSGNGTRHTVPATTEENRERNAERA